jgi:hypothetical protein
MMRAVVVIVVTGTWAFNFVYKDGTHTQGYCTFRQEESRLTGACGPETTGGSALTGEIAGGEVRWQVQDGPAYKAVLDGQGTFMRGAFTGDGDGIFTATKLTGAK